MINFNEFWNLLKNIKSCNKINLSKIDNPTSKANMSVEIEVYDNFIFFTEKGVLTLEDGTTFNATNRIKWEKTENKIIFSRKRAGEFEPLFEITKTGSFPHT